ncbi:integron gene cassette protein, partial [Rhodopirellula maiorica SM1]
MEKDGSDDSGVESSLPTPPEDATRVATPNTDQNDAPKYHPKLERQSKQMGDEEFAALIAALHNTGGNEVEFKAAIKAAQELDKLEDRSHLPELYKLLKETDDLFVRENVGLAIANMDGLNALPELLIAIRADGHDYDGLVSQLMWIVEDNSTESVPLLLD